MENDIKEMMNPSKVFLPIDETAILKIKSKTVLRQVINNLNIKI